MAVTTHELLCAYLDCRKRKRNTAAAAHFEARLNQNIQRLKSDLNAGTYEIGPSRCFAVTKPRPREIWAGAFRDRVVHHLIYNAISPAFIKTFSADSSACLPGRGTHYGAKRLEAKIRSATQNWSQRCYFLKLDLSNFFIAIHKPTLFELLAPKIEDPWMLDLVEQVLFHDPTSSFVYSGNAKNLELVPPHKRLFNAAPGCGLPSGNLPSQFFANVKLNPLDQFVAHKVKPKGYARYVDDFVLLHPDPQWLTWAKSEIEAFLEDRLRMQINPRKTILQPVEHGVDFVGHVIKPWHTIPRRTLPARAVATARSADEAMPERLNSYLGLMRQTQSHNARAALCREALRQGYSVDHRFTKVYRRAA